MSGGDIAAIIAASGFVLFVLFLAIPLVKLGAVLDETKDVVRTMNEEAAPLLSELTKTVQATNVQLAKVDSITENISSVTTNISSLVAVFSAAIGSPLAKIAGITSGLRSVLKGKK
ncbi:MAG: DUF948 domain-containing protein [Micrococcales bacterium]